jgi:hypothetical protein
LPTSLFYNTTPLDPTKAANNSPFQNITETPAMAGF